MRSSLICLAAALVPLTLAAPVDELEHLRQTNRIIGRKENETPSVAALLAHFESQKAYYESNSTSVEKRQTRTGRASGTPEDKYAVEYNFQVPVGQDTLKMHFSTESPDFWVYSSKLPAAVKAGHSVYNLGGTKKANYYTNIKTGQFQVQGDIYTDKVTIGGYTATQEIETATTMSDYAIQSTAAYDGVVGWGWPTGKTGCYPYDCKPWWSSTYTQQEKHGFSIAFKPKQAIWDNGFVDSSLYTGELFYTTGYNYRTGWDFFANGVSVGTNAPIKVYGSDLYSSVHSDLYFIFATPAIRADYYSKVKGAKMDAAIGNLWTFPCSATLPDFNIFISDVGGNRRVKRTAPGKYMNLLPYNTGNTRCIGAVQDFSHPDLDLVLGVPFLKSQYVHFFNELYGGTAPVIGFAQQKQ